MSKRHRKTKTRRVHRKSSRRHRQRGGFIELNPADVNDSSMNTPARVSMLQGQNYGSQHANQHGGQMNMAPLNAPPMRMNNPPPQMGGQMNMAPVNMPPPNIPVPRINTQPQMGGTAPINYDGNLPADLHAYARDGPQLQAFKDIAGMSDNQAGGRRRRKSRRSSRRRMRGGWAPVDSSDTLLPTDMEQQAVMGMNPEWKLAENPAAFDPLSK